MNNKKFNLNNPLISVLMPNYNCEKYIISAIESILNQTYKNFEFIIVDDCSTDDSWKIIQAYAKKDKRIRCFRNKENLKVVKTLNYGLTKCHGEYTVRMDSDDISHPQRLSIQIRFLEQNKNLIGCGTGLEYFWDNKKTRIKRLYPHATRKNKFISSPFAHATIMLRTTFYQEYQYSSEFLYCEDWELWIKLLKKHQIGNINNYLYFYRQFKNQTTHVHTKKVIINGFKMRFRYMVLIDYLNLKLIMRIIGESVLLFFPKRLIFYLFYKLGFKSKNKK